MKIFSVLDEGDSVWILKRNFGGSWMSVGSEASRSSIGTLSVINILVRRKGSDTIRGANKNGVSSMFEI
jgi:hypothetical protein